MSRPLHAQRVCFEPTIWVLNKRATDRRSVVMSLASARKNDSRFDNLSNTSTWKLSLRICFASPVFDTCTLLVEYPSLFTLGAKLNCSSFGDLNLALDGPVEIR